MPPSSRGVARLPAHLDEDVAKTDKERDSVTDGRENPPPFVCVYRTVTSFRYLARRACSLNGIPELAKGLVFYYFTRRLIKNEKQMRIFLIVFIACQSFRVFYPVFLHVTQGYWGDKAYSGDTGEYMDRLAGSPYDPINPNGLAVVILTILPFLHFFSAGGGPILLRLYYMVSIPILGWALILTSSRSGFLTALVFLAWAVMRSRKKLLFTIGAVAAVFILLAYASPERLERLQSIYRSDVKGASTAQGRVEAWKEDIDVALDAPIFGHGLGTSLEAVYNTIGRATMSHDLYLTGLARTRDSRAYHISRVPCCVNAGLLFLLSPKKHRTLFCVSCPMQQALGFS